MKIKGVSIWTWLLGMVVCTTIVIIAVPRLNAAKAKAEKGSVSLEIVKEDLWGKDYNYEIRGKIYNPRSQPARDVHVSYEVWGRWKGKSGHGTIIQKDGGLLADTIRYIPAGCTVDFTATGFAPTMEKQGDVPDPLKARITEGGQ